MKLWVVIKKIATIIALFGLALATLNSTGFCLREMRYLSDAEKLEIVKHHFSDPETKNQCVIVHTANSETMKYKICNSPYPDIASFEKTNPNCCKVINGDDNLDEMGRPRLGDKLFGISNFIGKAKYFKTEYKWDISPGKPTFTDDLKPDEVKKGEVIREEYFDNCGRSCVDTFIDSGFVVSIIISLLGSCCHFD